jgi:hypothetical protein
MAKNRVLKTRRDGVKQHYHVGSNNTPAPVRATIKIIGVAGGAVVGATKEVRDAIRDYRRQRAAKKKEGERVAYLLSDADHNSWAARRHRAITASIANLRRGSWGEQSFLGEGAPLRELSQPSEYVKLLNCGVKEAVAWSRTGCPPVFAAKFQVRGVGPEKALKLYEEAKARRDAERAPRQRFAVAAA